MNKGIVESMKDEQRKLNGEHKTLKRALENSKKLLEEVDKEKSRLNFELKRIAGNTMNKYQSAYAEAEIHRKKALNSISTAGASTMN